MQSFTFSTLIFSQLQKRILSLPSSDKESTVTFLPEGDSLKVFYNNKVDKSEVSSLFHEQMPISNFSGIPKIASSLISNFQAIKIPDTGHTDKYPQCKEVNISFTDAVMTLEYEVKWNTHSAPNKNKLNFALVESSKDLEQYDSLFSQHSSEVISIDTSTLLESIQQVGFIKSDVNAKEANGSYFEFQDDDFYAISTDSNLAVRYKSKIKQPIKGKQSCILTNASMAVLRTFVADTLVCNIHIDKSSIFIQADSRKMLLPRMSGKYLIADHASFFNLKTLNPVACLDLKPLVASLNALSSKSVDLYKKVTLSFNDKRLDLKTQADSADNVPCLSIANLAEINVNGDFLSLTCQRVLTLDLFSNLFFDSENDRIGLATEESDKLVFLIQGLSF